MNQRQTTREQILGKKAKETQATKDLKPTPNKLQKPPGNGGLFFGLSPQLNFLRHKKTLPKIGRVCGWVV
jgi:hypothetical protein